MDRGLNTLDFPVGWRLYGPDTGYFSVAFESSPCRLKPVCMWTGIRKVIRGYDGGLFSLGQQDATSASLFVPRKLYQNMNG